MPSQFWWLILGVPLLVALFVAAVAHPFRKVSAALSLGSALLCFGVSVWGIVSKSMAPSFFSWLQAGSFSISFGFTLDGLAQVMLLVVTGVGFLIHLFSLGYMRGEKGWSRYFGCLSLFMFSMTGIVVSNNLLMIFIFWELVGVSSYALIGFWFERDSAAAAANKAFIVNRIGDFGFLLGILGVWTLLGSLNFVELKNGVAISQLNGVDQTLFTLSILGLFCGVMGKSAQIPLHVWLPDAMEGPTPVSALIHAATMVAAGVYFLCRIFFLLELAPIALQVVAAIGGVTSLFAAIIATQQNDIKRILAYSTLSQLGLMVMAVGVAAPGAAMFHLTTHAFFKALLFLGAGSVIHALHHEQMIWQMGGLNRRMPITALCFTVGMLALAGCPGLSGFFSKETILAAAWAKNPVWFWVGLLTTFLTAFYMMRLLVVVFWGEEKSRSAKEAHESSWVMLVPLFLLAILSVVAGWGHVLADHIGFPQNHEGTGGSFVMGASITVFVLGLGLAWLSYRNRSKEIWHWPLVEKAFGVDRIYQKVFVRGHDVLSCVWSGIDRFLIQGIVVRGGAWTVAGMGHVCRAMQSGSLQGYVFLFGVGLAIILWWLWKG
ncbi:MAG: NADH-quinone oxidoreductase subunit L [Verrucomicrobiia bacterium]